MNNEELWQAVLGTVEVSLSRGNFNTWFKNTAIVERGPEYLIVTVPSTFNRDWIANKYHQDLLKALKSIAPEIREIKYQVGQRAKPSPAISRQLPPTNSNAPAVRENGLSGNSGLNLTYTFDAFVIGKNNELAHAAGLAVSKTPGALYNPLFIYGGVGLGKTHLMQAVGNQLLRTNPGAKVLYATSEKFTNDYVNAISTKRMDEFKKLYRGVDALLVDDIQFIAGKEQTQEEFFHTFNELRDKGKQIILTADRQPKEITAIEQRLVSRFEWGMVADMQSPNLETRLAILHSKSLKKQAHLSEDILYYIAENITNNIRELEGALNRLAVYQQMGGQPIALEQAKQILTSVVNAKKKSMTLKKIAMSVAEFYNVTVDDLLRQSRRKEFVKPRQIAMYLARKELGSSFPTIGEFFGGRDHTTVMHGVEKIENALTSTSSFKQEVDLIMDKLYIS